MNKSPIRCAVLVRDGVVSTTASLTVVFGPDPSHQRMMVASHVRGVDEPADEAAVIAGLRKQIADAMHHNLLNDDWSYA